MRYDDVEINCEVDRTLIKVKLKEVLYEKGISQNELAKKADIRRAALSALNHTNRTNINLLHIEKIMNALDIKSFDEILEIVPDED